MESDAYGHFLRYFYASKKKMVGRGKMKMVYLRNFTSEDVFDLQKYKYTDSTSEEIQQKLGFELDHEYVNRRGNEVCFYIKAL